jgi:hypothetical protein
MRWTLVPVVVVLGLMSPGMSAHTVIDVDDVVYSEDVEYDPLAVEFARRQAEIKAELDEGTTADWAGEYYRGDGMGANVSIVLAPDHGFASIWTGCMGVYGQSFGSVTQQGGRLLLNHEMPNQPGVFGNFPNVLVPVRHGERLYLVGEEQIPEFVRAVDAGAEPCEDYCPELFLRDSDRFLTSTRIPDLPSETGINMRDFALFARVITVIEPDLDAVDGEFRWRKAKVELDVGRDGGVEEGMEFYSSTAGWITDTIRVVKVKDRSALATVSAYAMTPIPVGSGTCVSTYFDDAIEKRVDGRPQDGCDGVAVAGR